MKINGLTLKETNKAYRVFNRVIVHDCAGRDKREYTIVLISQSFVITCDEQNLVVLIAGECVQIRLTK